MDKQEQLRSMLAAGWTVSRIRETTRMHTKTIAKFRRKWQSDQSDLGVSTGHFTSVDTPNHFASPDPSVQSDSPVSTEVESVSDPFRASTQSDQLSKLVDVIAALLEIAPDATARWIWQKLVENHGYVGSDRSVRRYLQKLRRTSPTFFLRLSSLPGQEAQVDYAVGPMVMHEGKPKRSWFFKMTLSHSRHSYEELVFRQDLETFIRMYSFSLGLAALKLRSFLKFSLCFIFRLESAPTTRVGIYRPRSVFSEAFCPCLDPSGSNHFGTSFGTRRRALVRYTMAPHGTSWDNTRHLETRM